MNRFRRALGRPPSQRRFGGARITVLTVCALLTAACGTSKPGVPQVTASGSEGSSLVSRSPEWFGIEMTDVRSRDIFTIDAFAGKVVLIETMAQWCPTCVEQQAEMIRLRELLGDPSDLISISLDVDIHEDEASLAEYVESHGYDWSFAVAPLEVARALGNLYSAQYLNPPLAPMLLIDRDGGAVQLPYGLKKAEMLRDFVDAYLAG